MYKIVVAIGPLLALPYSLFPAGGDAPKGSSLEGVTLADTGTTARGFGKRTWEMLDRINVQQTQRVGEANVYSPSTLESGFVVLLNKETADLSTLEIPVGGCLIEYPNSIEIDYKSDRIVAMGVPEPYFQCWPESSLSGWDYTGGCWSPTTYDNNTHCYVRKCTKSTGACTFTTTVTVNGQPQTDTHNGNCGGANLSQVTRCGGELCFEDT